MDDIKKIEEEVSLFDLFSILKRNFFIVCLLTVLVVVIGIIIINSFVTPTYKSTGSVLLSIDSIEEVNDEIDERIILEKEKLKMGTVVDFMTMDIVLEKVANDLGGTYSLSEIKNMVSITYFMTSYFINITCEAPNPNDSKLIVNSIIDNTISESSMAGISAYIKNIEVIQRAKDGQSLSLQIPRNIAYLLAAGLVFSFIVVLIKELTSNQFHRKNDIESMLGIPIIGTIFDIKQKKGKKSLSKYNQAAYSRLHHAIQFTDKDKQPRIIQITSSIPGEGKTTSTANLGKSMANDGQRVLIIDLDLRKPQLAKQFGVNPKKGIIDLVAGAANIEDAIVTVQTNLDIISAGTRVDDPVAVLKSKKLRSFLKLASENYDYVLLDSTPIVVYSDALIIAEYVDAVVYTVALEKTKKDIVGEAIAELKKTTAKVIGINLTHVKFDKKRASYYY